MIDPVTRWFEIIQYNNKHAISMKKLVETKWVTIYPRPTEIMYDQGSEIIGHEFRKSLVEEKYGIISKPINLVNLTYNAILEQIHQILSNLVRPYIIKETYKNENDR